MTTTLGTYRWQSTERDFIFLPPLSSPDPPLSTPSPPCPLGAHSRSIAELAAAISTFRLAKGVKGEPANVQRKLRALTGEC